MTNSRASKGKLVLLDHHLATGTEATYTYTETLDMKNTYRELKIIITGSATAAFALKMKINGQTDYDYSNNIGDTTTLATSLVTANTTVSCIPNTILDGAKPFYVEMKIVLNDATDTLMLVVIAGAPHEGNNLIVGEAQAGSTTTVTSINTATSSSTWIAGTEITTYGIKR